MGEKKMISLRNILSALVALVILIVMVTWHANFVLARSLAFAFPDWQVTFHSARPRIFGGVVASDVTMTPLDGEDASFHFKRVSLSVPFFEFYRSAFSRKHGALLKSIHNLHFEFSGGHGDLSESFTSELALVGNATAAPFETEGCMQDVVWIEGELEEMGLTPTGVELMLDYHSEFGHFVIAQALDAPGIGRIESKREIRQLGNFAILKLVHLGPSQLVADEWHIKDEGFVAARNRYCAQKDKVTANQFVQRHVRSVERVLAAIGLAPTAQMESAYADYARAGGSLDMSVHYDPPIGGDLYESTDFSAWLPRAHGQFAVNGQTQPLAFVATQVKPFPDYADDMSTFDLVQREDAIAAAVAAASAPPPDSQPRNATSVSTLAATTVNTPSIVSTTAASASATIATALPMPVKLASSIAPSKLLAAAVVATAPAAAPVDDGVISDYRKLAGYVGKHLTIYQRGRASIRVEVLRVAKNGEVVVRREFRDGYAVYALHREAFEHAEL